MQMQMATQHWSAHLLLDYHAEYLDHVQVLLVLIASGLRLYACNLKGVVPARQHACKARYPHLRAHTLSCMLPNVSIHTHVGQFHELMPQGCYILLCVILFL